ncbi:thiamine biosynthesis protein ThiS [Shewanella sediminis HAW-EB3]|uniref:Thiamine biosynthesis protein ThiS n=1 Tax=Shewanella sediminis (strain HAW-EB3) TaxID=425104 RepID=A8FUV2_SHESH|nr:sulfur carrier protein ThiS [Shewanella sediminis]ABV36625.1 thiamine biosynthesis protein ThiS [Shewanella sediminis HAW-EB3]
MNPTKPVLESKHVSTITVSINDLPHIIPETLSIEGLLLAQNIAINSVAVVCNSKVVTKGLWKEQACVEGDSFEVFAVVAGG